MVVSLKKVLISDEVDQKCVTILEENGIEVVKNTKLSKEELLKEISAYDGLIVRSATKVTADVIKAGTNLKIIGRAGTGVDNIDCKAATEHGVIVMNTPGGNTLSAAEHTCTLLLAVSRHVSTGTASLRADRWDRKRLLGNEVGGKTLAIIGLGRIGREVALRMQAFQMTTIGFDPIISGSESAEFGVEWFPLEEIWKRADYITVHTPLIPQTKNLINDAVFEQCKKGVRIINCARGGIIDEDALLRALKSGKCAGAGLDVFVQEPPTGSALLQHDLVTSTPHLGANTVEAQTRVAEEIAQQFVELTQGIRLVGAINASVLSEALSAATQPWVQTASSLTTLACKMFLKGKLPTTIHITASGACLEKADAYLRAAVAVGYLRAQSDTPHNLINAPAAAKDAGLTVTSEYLSHVGNENSHPAQVSLTIQSGIGDSASTSRHELVATVAGGHPQLLRLDGADFAAGVELSGHQVVFGSKTDKQTSTLAAVLGDVGSQSSVQAFSTTSATNSQVWNFMRVLPQVADSGTIQRHCLTLVSF